MRNAAYARYAATTSRRIPRFSGADFLQCVIENSFAWSLSLATTSQGAPDAGEHPYQERSTSPINAQVGDPVPGPTLMVVVGRHPLRCIYAPEGCYFYVLFADVSEVRLVSRVAPAARKTFGTKNPGRMDICIERIVLRGENEVQEVPLDHPGLIDGWGTVERHGTMLRRSINGGAVLPLPARTESGLLEISTCSSSLPSAQKGGARKSP